MYDVPTLFPPRHTTFTLLQSPSVVFSQEVLTMRRHLDNQRGVTLAFTAVALAAFIALTVVGVDLSRLALTATEVQSVADIAATAGAKSLYENAYNGGTRQPVDDAHAVAATNSIDARLATAQNGIIVNPVIGHYDFGTRTFTAGNPQDAVMATVTTTVDNIVAAAIGTPQTTVVKDAIAAFSGPAEGCAPPANCASNDWACFCQNGVPPCLPIAAPSCQFTSGNQLPPLRVASAGNDTAAWTGFQTGHSDNVVRDFLDQPPTCNAPGNSDAAPGEQIVGPTIDVTNGLNPSGPNNVFGLMQCIWENELGCDDPDNDGDIDGPGGTIFTIPIFNLEGGCTTNPTGLQELVGFATVRVTGVTVDGSDKYIDLQTIARIPLGGTRVGGGCFGTGCTMILAK
jgi:hypothetical protein